MSDNTYKIDFEAGKLKHSEKGMSNSQILMKSIGSMRE